jgi:dissimilatory sulfite reductase (desulfoviridin) alpha/beta subunit
MNMDFHELKKGGFIKEQGRDLFLMRLRTIGGYLTSRDLENIARIASKYGRGEVHLTTRQGVEIPGVSLEKYQELIAEIRALNLLPGGLWSAGTLHCRLPGQGNLFQRGN